MKIFVEGYGCSMNIAETESIIGHAVENDYSQTLNPKDADFLVINTCAVKEQTETNMLRRISELKKISEQNNSQLIVFGCLPEVSRHRIKSLAGDIICIGPDLRKLSQVLGIREEEFSPSINASSYNPNICIIPINSGCTNFCTFCGTKLARGNVRSYSPDKIKERFEKALNHSKEFWLTSQDTGAYGLDINYSLPSLLKDLLSLDGDFRIRIGMMNPHHLRRIYSELIPLFGDGRIYNFLHVPFQSGSDAILKKMRRGYTVKQYEQLISDLKRDVPDITIATDVIVGFPSETEGDFSGTVSVLRNTVPDVVNISRFGPRPNTVAFSMSGQISGKVKKERSRKLTSLCRTFSFMQNEKMLGRKEKIFISEAGYKGGFLGRTSNYKPVIIESDFLGKFVDVVIEDAYPTYLKGRAVGGQEKSEELILRGISN